jgi:antitoxin component YwqK of YwqJK toxin-antitoxin module
VGRYDDAGQRHGTTEQWSATGELVSRQVFEHGRKTGVWIFTDANGVTHEQEWINGKLKRVRPRRRRCQR